VPHFVFGNCHGDSTFNYLLLAQLALHSGSLSMFAPGRAIPNFTVDIGHVPSCGFNDQGDGLLDMWRGATDLGQPIAFTGCGCSRATLTLALLAAPAKTPIISGHATSILLSGEEYPSFMRTVPTDFVQAECQAQLIFRFGWKHMVYLTFYSEVYGNFLANQVLTLLSSEHAYVKFLNKQPLRDPVTWTSFNISIVQDDIRRIFPSNKLWARVIAMASDSSRLDTVYMYEMKRYGCLHDGTVFMFPDSTSSLTGFREISSNLAAWQAVDQGGYFDDPYWLDPAASAVGVLATLASVQQGILHQGSFFYEWLAGLSVRNLTQFGMPAEYEVPSAAAVEASIGARLVWDAVLTLFLGIADLLNEGVPSEDIHGERLLLAMRAQSFLGMTGQVLFDSRGERRGAEYSVLNLQRSEGTLQFVRVLRYVAAGSTDGEFELRSDALQPVSNTEIVLASGSSYLPDIIQCGAGYQGAAYILHHDGKRQEVCQPCRRGAFREANYSGLTCQDCPARHYASDIGSTYCQQCSSGQFNDLPGASTCTACPPGQAQALVTQSSCLACRPGRFAANPGQSVCDACEVGRFQEQHGMTSCIACPEHMSTERPESRLNASCHCKPGKYYDEAQGMCLDAPVGRDCPFASYLSDCQCQAGMRASYDDATCVRCERHLYCPGGHMLSLPGDIAGNVDETVQVEEGYMTLPHEPYAVFKCISDRVCRGRRSPFNASGPGRICLENVKISPSCGRCQEDHWGHASRRCTPCEGSDAVIFYAKVSLTFLANLALTVYLYKRFNRPNPLGLITLACVISMMQSLQTVGKMPLQWPGALKFIFELLDYIFTIQGLMDSLQFRTECLAGNDYVGRLSREAVSPMLIFIDFAILWGLAKAIRKKLKWPYVHNIIGLVFTRLFITIIRLSLSLFYREHMPNGKVMIISVPELEFLSDDWFRALPIGVSATALYGCSIAAYVMYLVLVAPRRAAQDPAFMSKARFCFGNFRPDRHWWILIQLAYGFALNLAQVIMPASNIHSKLYLALLFLIIFLVVEFKAQPFRFAANTAVDLMLNTFLIVLLVVATSFIPPHAAADSSNRSWNEVYANIVIACFAGCLILAAYQVMCWICASAQAKGIVEGHRAHYGWQFRDCAVAMLLLPDSELTRRVSSFGDHDLNMLKCCTETIITMLFSAQVTTNRLHQRLIPGHEYHVWNYEEMQLDVWEKIQTGHLANRVSRSYRVRAWLLQMSLKACEQSQKELGVSHFRNARKSGFMHQSFSEMSSTAAAGAANTASSLAMTFKGHRPHVARLLQALEIDAAPVTRSSFRRRVRAAFPTLDIPKQEVDMIFNTMDINSESLLHRTNFVLTLNAMVPEWMLSTMLTSLSDGNDSPSPIMTPQVTDPKDLSDPNMRSVMRIESVMGQFLGRRTSTSAPDRNGDRGSNTSGDETGELPVGVVSFGEAVTSEPSETSIVAYVDADAAKGAGGSEAQSLATQAKTLSAPMPVSPSKRTEACMDMDPNMVVVDL